MSNDSTVSCVICNDIRPQGPPVFLQPTSPNIFNVSLCVEASVAGLIPSASSWMSNSHTVNICTHFSTSLKKTWLVLQNAVCCDARKASPKAAPPRNNAPLDDDDGQPEGPAGGPISGTHAGRGCIVKRIVLRLVCTHHHCTGCFVSSQFKAGVWVKMKTPPPSICEGGVN